MLILKSNDWMWYAGFGIPHFLGLCGQNPALFNADLNGAMNIGKKDLKERKLNQQWCWTRQ
jgi:hypothetical protein